jgi:glycosyltransferase involved in cell wall biosynthesis
MNTLINSTYTKYFKNSDRAEGKRQPAVSLISVHGDPTAKIGQDGAGGQNVYVRELGLALAKQGYLVDMFTRRENPHQEEIVEMAPGCRTIRLTAGPAQFIHRNDLFDYLPTFVDAWLNFQRRSDREYVLLHTNYWLSGWVGLQLKFRLEIPQVHTYHSLGAVKYQNVENPPPIAEIRHSVEWACLEQSDCVISTSPEEVEDLRRFVSKQGRIKIIPCGIDADHFGSVSQALARQQLGIAPDCRLILYVGRFDPRKGIETLVKACAQVPQPFQLYLVGGSRPGERDSQEQQRIKTLVKSLGLAPVTIFTGQVSQQELPAYYAAADVCAIPSYYEPFGLVAIEAMAAGTPVIASEVGGLRHTVVDGETGLLVPPRNPKVLAVAIEQLLSQPKCRQAYGKKAQKWVQSRFSCSAVAKQIHELYQSLTLVESLPANANSPIWTSKVQQLTHRLSHSKGLKKPELVAIEQLLESLETQKQAIG